MLAFRKDKPDILLPALDFDIGFIGHGNVVDSSFIGKIELVGIVSHRLCVIQHRLIGDLMSKDLTHHLGCFSGAHGKCDIKGEDKPHHLIRVMDSKEVDFCFPGFIRRTMLNLL